MAEMAKTVAAGMFFIAIGVTMLVFRRKFVDDMAAGNRRIGFKYDSTDIVIARIITVIVGAGFIASGLAILFGVGKV